MKNFILFCLHDDLEMSSIPAIEKRQDLAPSASPECGAVTGTASADVLTVQPLEVISDNPVVAENVVGVVPGSGPRSSSFTASVIESTLAPLNGVHVTQELSKMEDVTCGCCQVRNKYFFRENNKGGRVVFTATEQSGCCERCWCSPKHSMMVHIKDNNQEDMFTLERQGCFFAKPFLCCFPIGQGCVDEMTIHTGKVDDEAGKVINPKAIYTVKQASGCDDDLCHPQVKVFTPYANKPEILLTGPQCFGGCTDLCKESRFNATGTDNQDKGYVLKEVPRTCMEMMREICTDKDSYRIVFNEVVSAKEKAALLTGALLIDIMYYERDNGACTCVNKEYLCINCCNCYCMGCLVPWQVCLPNPLLLCSSEAY